MRSQSQSDPPPLPAVAHRTALVLTGGGARTAYQVGVLDEMQRWNVDGGPMFRILCGTSAGAINAAVLAGNADDPRRGIRHLAGVWEHLRPSDVYRSGWLALYGRAAHWLSAFALGGLARHNPTALLDNSPLRALLERHVNLSRVRYQIHRGSLRALALTAASYGSGRSVSWFEGHGDIGEWARVRRCGLRMHLTLDHVMASLALPFLFPAVRVGDDWLGDGAMRDMAPLSTAIHLGADRLLVVGTRNDDPPTGPAATEYPTLGRIGGYILDSLFMDSVSADLERLTRMNRLLASNDGVELVEDGRRLTPIEHLVLLPSADLREVAAAHLHRFPVTVRHILGRIGAFREGSALPSYLLFDGAFCGELMDLGRHDARRRRTELEHFLRPEARQDGSCRPAPSAAPEP